MTPTSMPSCRYCGTELKKNTARTCANCHQLQHPFGMLVGKLSIGEISLFGSIIVLLFATFKSVIWGKEAEIGLQVLGCSTNTISAAVFNTGEATGIVTTPALYLASDLAVALPVSLAGSEDGKTKHLAFSIAPKTPPKLLDFTFEPENRQYIAAEILKNPTSCDIHLGLNIYETHRSLAGNLVKPACSCKDIL